MKKILLIDPPGLIENFNTGIAYIAGSLRKNGYELNVLDFNIDKTNQDMRLEKALSEGFDVVGLSVKSTTLTPSVKIAERCKQMNNDIVVITGGPEVTVEGTKFLEENTAFDYAFLGDAEESVLQFLQFLEGKATIDSVHGLCYRRDGRIQTNPKSVPLDLDTIPFPDYSAFDTFGEKPTPFYPLVTSRGCPYDCTYCSVPIVSGKRFRARSATNVVDELEQVKQRYGFKEFVVLDDTFTQKIDRAKEVCRELIKRRLDYTWHCFNGVRADRLDSELLSLMRESGCEDIWFGVESLDPDVFGMIKKGETIEEIISALKMTRAAGINISCFFIIGLPGSTYKKDLETLRKAKKLGIHNTHWGLATPFPGTALWDWVKANGRILRDYRTVTIFIEPDCAFETDNYQERERLKMFYKANLAFYNYRDLMSTVDLKGLLHVMKMIVRYDPLRLPVHVMVGLGRLFKRVKSSVVRGKGLFRHAEVSTK